VKILGRALLGAVCLLPAQPLLAEYDLIIRGGRLLDGSGNPWIYADVAIKGDRIVAVGSLGSERALRVVEADGLYVAPGFIDTHSHAAGGLVDPIRSAAQPLLAQGITTVVVNPDGSGAVNLKDQATKLEEHGLGVNVGQMVPHGSVRGQVIGSVDRHATPEEMEKMRGLVRRGMEAGAFGLSTGPFYAPGSFAPTSELIELAKVAAEFGGIHQSHIRDESDYTIGVVAAVDEVIEISEAAGLPGIVTHIKALGPRVWGTSAELVERIERARERGVEIFADQYPYDASSTSLSAALLPRWALEGGLEELLTRLRDPGMRARIRQEVLENLERRGGGDRIRIASFREHPDLAGQTLAEIARDRGLEDVDAALALLEVGSPGIVSFNMHEEDIERFMRQPWMMTASDGGLPVFGAGVPHPRGYGAFPRRIRVYVQERGVTDLATAIRSMTHLPASVFRMRERGIIREGAFADIVVFDLDRLRDTATFDQPHQLAEGMVHVLVNGQFAIEDGEFTGHLPGRVLQR
jgi:N-acyl-D-amino-acid deacylase